MATKLDDLCVVWFIPLLIELTWVTSGDGAVHMSLMIWHKWFKSEQFTQMMTLKLVQTFFLLESQSEAK